MMFRETPTFTAWLSRDGMPQIYWGGATSRRERYCACGETSKRQVIKRAEFTLREFLALLEFLCR